MVFNDLTQSAVGIGIFSFVIVIISVMIATLGTQVTGTANATAQFLLGALGSTGGGLASWTYIIVIAFVGAIIIGLLFRAFGGAGRR